MGSSMLLRQTLLALCSLSLISAMGFIGGGSHHKKNHGDYPQDFPLWPAGFQMGCKCTCPGKVSSAPTTAKATTPAPTTARPTTVPTTTPLREQVRQIVQKDIQKPVVQPKPTTPKPIVPKVKPVQKLNDIDGNDEANSSGKKGGLHGRAGSAEPLPPTAKPLVAHSDLTIRKPVDPTAPKAVGNIKNGYKIDSPFDPDAPLAPVDGSLDFNIADPRKPQGPRKTIDPDA